MDTNTLTTVAATLILSAVVKEIVSAVAGWIKRTYSATTVMHTFRIFFTSVHLNPVIDAATIFGILWYLHHRFGGQAFIAGSDAPDLIAIGLAAGYFANSFIRGCEAIRRSRQP